MASSQNSDRPRLKQALLATVKCVIQAFVIIPELLEALSSQSG
jgi:hypothetical protein